MATGQLLIELDHDDTLTPDALELLRDALLETCLTPPPHPAISYVAHTVTTLDFLHPDPPTAPSHTKAKACHMATGQLLIELLCLAPRVD
jgi:hypothetical protein